MKYSFKSTAITSMEQWRDTIYIGAKAGHWKEGRSAHSMAEFMMKKNGEAIICKMVSEAIGEEVLLERAEPEKEIKFDAYRHGREHDLAIWGKTQSGKSLFIGIEAKVDERFSDTIGVAYQKAQAKKRQNYASKAPNRIEELYQLHFGSAINAEHGDLRYQLMYCTVGTLKPQAEISVLLVLVFKTGKAYDEVKGQRNHADYRQFLNACNAQPIKKNALIEVDELTLVGQKLTCIHAIV